MKALAFSGKDYGPARLDILQNELDNKVQNTKKNSSRKNNSSSSSNYKDISKSNKVSQQRNSSINTGDIELSNSKREGEITPLKGSAALKSSGDSFRAKESINKDRRSSNINNSSNSNQLVNDNNNINFNNSSSTSKVNKSSNSKSGTSLSKGGSSKDSKKLLYVHSRDAQFANIYPSHESMT